ncbi:hypothetical protein MMC20_006807 [Loxospora ochrophaea]|nr:hypothetical protein [Loxospora ochrophaea]
MSTTFSCGHSEGAPLPLRTTGHTPSSLPHSCYACSWYEAHMKIINAFISFDAEIHELDEEVMYGREEHEKETIQEREAADEAAIEQIKKLQEQKVKLKRDVLEAWKKTWGVKSLPREDLDFFMEPQFWDFRDGKIEM